MAQKTIWLTYDLGLKGDYTSLYSWLDEHEAQECGNNTAFFKYESNSEQIEIEILDDLTKSISFNKTDRIYLIYPTNEAFVGKFIIGGRKRAPWEGFAVDIDSSVVDK